MDTLTLLLVVLGAVVVLRIAWWWFVGRNTPRFPPLAIDDDDPAMIAATADARASLDRFRELLAAGVKEAQVKVPFVTSSGEREHLWAEVLSITADMVSVRYLTPPVSHSGKLERIHEHPISEIEDWAAISENGEIRGGYTQRVMFERAREQWGTLPPELEKQASRYVG